MDLLSAIEPPVNRTNGPPYQRLDPKYSKNSRKARRTSTFVRQNTFMVQTLHDVTIHLAGVQFPDQNLSPRREGTGPVDTITGARHQ